MTSICAVDIRAASFRKSFEFQTERVTSASGPEWLVSLVKLGSATGVEFSVDVIPKILSKVPQHFTVASAKTAHAIVCPVAICTALVIPETATGVSDRLMLE